MKRILSILLSIMLVLTLIPGMAWADVNADEPSLEGGERTIITAVFSDEALSDLTELSDLNQKFYNGKLKDVIEIDDEKSATKYAYKAVLQVDEANGTAKLINVETLPENCMVLACYVDHFDGERPIFENAKGLNITQDGTASNKITISADSSLEDKDVERYDIVFYQGVETNRKDLCRGTVRIKKKIPVDFIFPEGTEWNAYIEDENGNYILAKELNGNEGCQVPMVFDCDLKSNPKEFYIMREKGDGDQPKLSFWNLIPGAGKYDKAGSINVNIEKEIFTNPRNQKEYWVWKCSKDLQTNEKIRAGLTFSDKNDPKEMDWLNNMIWILGDKFLHPNNFLGAQGNAVPTTESPINKDWETLQELVDSGICFQNGKYPINMSVKPDAEENSFYLTYSQGENLEWMVTKEWNFDAADSTSLSGNRAGVFEEVLDNNVVNVTDVGTFNPVNENETYSVAKINLNNFHGREKLKILFSAGDRDRYCVELYMGSYITIKGDVEGFEKICDNGD